MKCNDCCCHWKQIEKTPRRVLRKTQMLEKNREKVQKMKPPFKQKKSNSIWIPSSKDFPKLFHTFSYQMLWTTMESAQRPLRLGKCIDSSFNWPHKKWRREVYWERDRIFNKLYAIYFPLRRSIRWSIKAWEISFIFGPYPFISFPSNTLWKFIEYDREFSAISSTHPLRKKTTRRMTWWKEFSGRKTNSSF